MKPVDRAHDGVDAGRRIGIRHGADDRRVEDLRVVKPAGTGEELNDGGAVGIGHGGAIGETAGDNAGSRQAARAQPDPGVEHADGQVGRATRIRPGEEGAGIGPATGAAGARFGPVGVVEPYGHARRDCLEFADRGWRVRPRRQAKGQHHQV